MQVDGLATKGKVLNNPFGGKAVAAHRTGLAVFLFHKVTLIQPEVYLGNALLDIYHIKIICKYLREDTTQQLLSLHDAKIINTYEIMCMRGKDLQLGFRTDPKLGEGRCMGVAFNTEPTRYWVEPMCCLRSLCAGIGSPSADFYLVVPHFRMPAM